MLKTNLEKLIKLMPDNTNMVYDDKNQILTIELNNEKGNLIYSFHIKDESRIDEILKLLEDRKANN